MFVLVIDLILEYKDIKVKEIAVDTGISESYIYNMLNGDKENISLDLLYKIANAIGEDPKNFFYAENEFETVQKLMEDSIELCGMMNTKTQLYSKILDRLFVLKLKS